VIGSPVTVADVGDDVIMTCTARGTPPPLRVYWLDDTHGEEYSSQTLTVGYVLVTITWYPV